MKNELPIDLMKKLPEKIIAKPGPGLLPRLNGQVVLTG